MNKKFQIIYLNGPSSSGKTTLGRALQEQLIEPYLLIGIDDLIDMMPKKSNNWYQDVETEGFSFNQTLSKDNKKVYRINAGPYGQRIIQAFKDMVITLASSGFNIIIDDVAFGKEPAVLWRQTLSPFNVLWVGVTAPIEVLEQRELKRTDRKNGSARWQAELVHQDVVYDIMVDTHKQSIAEIVAHLAEITKK